jgi:hypothetical protein
LPPASTLDADKTAHSYFPDFFALNGHSTVLPDGRVPKGRLLSLFESGLLVLSPCSLYRLQDTLVNPLALKLI